MGGSGAAPIVLLTDFGSSDAYVGMMRGVIQRINPAAPVIDLTHGIGAQDVRHGAVTLADSCRYFPAGSVFVAVVDPGVGTNRAAIVLETPQARFVAPDNGLLTLVCRQHDPTFGDAAEFVHAPTPAHCRAWRLTEPGYWLNPVSATFHGRDVFAPVAAHLSAGASPDSLGEPASTIATLPLPIPRPVDGAIDGRVLFADRFGNLVTDITTDLLSAIGIAPGASAATVSVAGRAITGLSRAFHDPPGSGLRALVGSHGRLEIAVVDGSAAAALTPAPDESVTVRRT